MAEGAADRSKTAVDGYVAAARHVDAAAALHDAANASGGKGMTAGFAIADLKVAAGAGIGRHLTNARVGDGAPWDGVTGAGVTGAGRDRGRGDGTAGGR